MATGTLETHTYTQPHRSLLERTFPISSIHLEIATYIAIIVLSIVAHLWQLDAMAMHHDESIHAWSSWRYYSGSGGFNCYGGATSASYCYDPVYHGPSLYMFTLLSYFLFGDGDAQARLPMAAAGVIMVASCWMMRPLIGRRGAIIAAVLLGFAPSLLYYTRFARHDGLMVLWEVWMVVAVFRYLQEGKARYLYLLAVSLALAIGTHELYYILLFIFGIFAMLRILSEIPLTNRYLHIALLVFLGLGVTLMIINPPLPIGKGLYLGEKAFLANTTLLLAWLCQRVWPQQPVLLNRLQDLWQNQRNTLWIALGILASLYLVMYTNFFSYPRGALDGLYAGLAYWLGSQQEYARGDQPWYYYLMQLPVYEPLGIITSIGAFIYLFTRKGTRPDSHEEQSSGNGQEPTNTSTYQTSATTMRMEDSQQQADTDGDGISDSADSDETTQPGTFTASKKTSKQTDSETTPQTSPTVTRTTTRLADDTENQTTSTMPSLFHRLYTELQPPTDMPNPQSPAAKMFPLLLVFWYISSIVIFSWAGEKMPWLVVHMSLPGNLVAAWVLGKLLTNLHTPAKLQAEAQTSHKLKSEKTHKEWQQREEPQPLRTLKLLIPPIVFLLILTLSVAIWRLQSAGEGQEAQSELVQGLVPLLVSGGLIYSLLTIGQRTGVRIVLSLTGLTIATILGAYMLRSTWLAVYDHPDTPIELLVYTQSAPDIPRYVEDVHELSMNMTRNNRSTEDVTGGQSLPIVVDNGDENGGGSLAWPMQWYFRNFRTIVWKGADSFQNPTTNTFEVTFPDGSKGLAPVIMAYKPHITDESREFFRKHYVTPYGDGGALNWWFPEGDKCSPNGAGYKKYYFHSWMPRLEEKVEKDCGRNISEEVNPPWAPLLWPFKGENWDTLKNFMLYRELPDPLTPGSRDMQVWIRNDVLQGFPNDGRKTSASSGDMSLIHLFAEQAIGSPAELQNPTGIAVDEDGNIYVADTANHRIQVFDRRGNLQQTIGSYGKGEGQFDEPRGVAVDEDGNIYVADTWNARIVKLSPEGEWLTTWGSGNQDVGSGHLATITGGNEEANAENPLGFFGPRGIRIGPRGNVYIADTGNKRIIVTDSEGEHLYQWGRAGSEAGAFNEPTGLAIDKSGNVYVADTWNGRVQIFPTGQDNRVQAAPIAMWDVAAWEADTYLDPSIGVIPDGTVFVSAPSENYVQAANLRGNILLRWGGQGTDLASLQGPSGIAVGPEGDVYVVDRAANRVLRFEIPRVRPDITTIETDGMTEGEEGGG